MTTPAPTQVPNIATLNAQATELRNAMVKALTDADDDASRKLSNELVAVKKQIFDIEVTAQGDARGTYQDSMHDALSTHEIPGMSMTVRFNDTDGMASLVYTPTDQTIDAVKAAIAGVERPTTVKGWVYGWELDQDGGLQPVFEFKSATKAKASTTTGTNGTRTTGWTTPSGEPIALADAFDACASQEEKQTLDKMVADKKGGSVTHSFKSKIVKAADYKKS